MQGECIVLRPRAASLKAFLTLPQASAGHPEPLCLRLRAPPASHHSWGIYSPMSGGSETLLYRLRAPPLTHRSWGTHPPWGVVPPPAVGRAQFPHSYKQISTPPPPIPLITVATAMPLTTPHHQSDHLLLAAGGQQLPVKRTQNPVQQMTRLMLPNLPIGFQSKIDQDMNLRCANVRERVIKSWWSL